MGALEVYGEWRDDLWDTARWAAGWEGGRGVEGRKGVMGWVGVAGLWAGGGYMCGWVGGWWW